MPCQGNQTREYRAIECREDHEEGVLRIVVSGASRGLGKAIAEYLAANHQVVTFARSESAERNPGIIHIPNIDASSVENLDALAGQLEEAEGLVNNVGIAYDGILATQGIESIRRVLDVNLLSTIYLTKLYIRGRLQQRKSGSVVFISSIVSTSGFSGLAVYSATKGAINSLTKSLAREMGGKGFRFNAVLPGYFESDLSAGLSETKRSMIVRRTPLGRLSSTADICPLVAFLLSDRAGFITGQLIAVDGGLTA